MADKVIDKDTLQLIRLIKDKEKLDKFIAEDERIKKYLLKLAESAKDSQSRISAIEKSVPSNHEFATRNIKTASDEIEKIKAQITAQVESLNRNKKSVDELAKSIGKRIDSLDTSVRSSLTGLSSQIDEINLNHKNTFEKFKVENGKDGLDGRSIERIEMSKDNRITVHYTDGTSDDLGRITPDNSDVRPIRFGGQKGFDIPKFTASTGDPSGGNNGDIWLKYTE